MTSDKHKKASPVIANTFGEKLEVWYENNGNLINIVLVVVVVGVLGYQTYHWMHNRTIAKANAAYGLAMNHFQMAAQIPDDAKKKDELQGAITAAKQVVTDYADQTVGHQAQLMIANAQYTIAATESGEKEAVPMLEKARDSYKRYLEMASTNSEKAVGNLALGNVQENLSFIKSDDKILKEAANAYTEAMSVADKTYLGAEARMALARVKSGRGKADNEDAAKMYEQVVKNRGVQLASDDSLKDIKPIKMDSGQTLSVDEIEQIKNLAAWSQHRMAEDELARLK